MSRRFAGRLGVVVVAAGLFGGCTQMQTQGLSPAYLIIDSLQGASGAEPSKLGTPVSSDVVTNVKKTVDGKEVLVPTVYEDPGQVTFELALKDPGGTGNPTAPTTTNFITISRYHVQFIRADGRNTPGVDVPYAFDGGLTLTVGTEPATTGLTLVRIQAKEEAPLKALSTGGSAIAISTIAQVTFYGVDQAGRAVTVTGNISVNFANWGDPN
ncbi:MAG: hypothetical protein ABI652_08360 [Acidobacteriota bacterium]